MGKAWDKSGIVFDPATWEAITSHLLPGAFGMAFASSRGWHRLACAIEDAGMRIHPSIFGWAFGSGFPKATRIKDATVFAGHRYGLQALKPALEPIIVFQKPYESKPIESIVKTGAGALNIDGGRISTSGESFERPVSHIGFHKGWDRPWRHDEEALLRERIRRDESQDKAESLGRWPANFYLGDEEAARRLGEQSGERSAPKPYHYKGKLEPSHEVYGNGLGWDNANHSQEYGDTGTAARFFFNVNRQIDEADPVLYCAKASRKERDAGLDCDAQRAPGYGYRHGLGDAGEGMFKDRDTQRRNHHPTVKPIDLTRWLATLLLPPAEYAPRRILVPFSGSGSEMIGSFLAGWEEIVGIEMEQEYVEIAEARLKHWTTNKEFIERSLIDNEPRD